MLDPELLDILVCPESKQPVRPADAELLERVNDGVSRGALRTRSGDPVQEPMVEALVRDDGTVLYPVRDGIPIMLIDESVPLGDLDSPR